MVLLAWSVAIAIYIYLEFTHTHTHIVNGFQGWDYINVFIETAGLLLLQNLELCFNSSTNTQIQSVGGSIHYNIIELIPILLEPKLHPKALHVVLILSIHQVLDWK